MIDWAPSKATRGLHERLLPMTIYGMRLMAMAIAVLAAVGIREEIVWQSTVTSIGFGHYLLSIWYARGRLSKLGAEWSTALPTLGAVIVGTLLYALGFPLIVYFAAHHVCNEAYMVAINGLSPRAERRLRVTAVALHTLLYFALLRSEFAEVFVRRGYLESPAAMQRPGWLFFAPLAVAYLVYFGTLLNVRRGLTRRELVELSLPEIAGLALLAASFFTPIRFLDVVCYHFVFWWFYPASKLAQRGRGAVVQYGAWMVLLVGATFLLSPAVLPDYPFRDSVYLKQFLLWSHIHITSSFFLSSAHPAWIRRWFMPRPAGGVSPANAAIATAGRPA
jgi:hypothetical protein